MNIKYKVEFFTDWHCGSGLAAGADVDALVIKDSQGFPYIPGKTIKGLVRQALEEILEYRGQELRERVNACFGFFDGTQENMKKGTDAESPEADRKAILKDALVIKDSQGFPYIPGKTIKGLVRQALEEMLDHRGQKLREKVNACFGFFDGTQESMKRGTVFFKNAELPEADRKAILKEKLMPYLFRNISSTAIDADGIAVPNSLRRIEVTVPCILEGEILDVDPDSVEAIKDALKYIKRLGLDRNRGLGRCSFSVEEKNDNQTSKK